MPVWDERSTELLARATFCAVLRGAFHVSLRIARRLIRICTNGVGMRSDAVRPETLPDAAFVYNGQA